MVKLVLRRSCAVLLGIVAAASVAVAQDIDESTPKPKITSVSKITTKKHQTITIKGTGFGTHDAYTGDTDFISLLDLTKKPVWEAGYKKDNDTVTLIVEEWKNTEIVLGGFAGDWGERNWTLAKGDEEWIRVWNAQTGEGPASVKVKISGAETTTEVSASSDSSAYGEPVTFTAVVKSDEGAPPDGETVSFKSGDKVLGTEKLTGGSASFTTSELDAGANSIKAVYSGDSELAKSASGEGESDPLIHTVN
jgi:hypothetical protein